MTKDYSPCASILNDTALPFATLFAFSVIYCGYIAYTHPQRVNHAAPTPSTRPVSQISEERVKESRLSNF